MSGTLFQTGDIVGSGTLFQTGDTVVTLRLQFLGHRIEVTCMDMFGNVTSISSLQYYHFMFLRYLNELIPSQAIIIVQYGMGGNIL
jgi:hypothetical protein